MKTTDERVPLVGDWFVLLDGSNVGMCVDVLLDGSEVILSRPMLDRTIETWHRTKDLKGPLRGKRVIPGHPGHQEK